MNRFNEHPDEEEEHPGGTFALAFDYLKFDTNQITFDLQSKDNVDALKPNFEEIFRIFFGDLQYNYGWSTNQIEYLNALINKQLVQDSHSLIYEDKIEVDY